MCQTHEMKDCESFKNWQELTKLSRLLFLSSDEVITRTIKLFSEWVENYNSDKVKANKQNFDFELIAPAERFWDTDANITYGQAMTEILAEQERRKNKTGCYGQWVLPSSIRG